MYWLNEYRNVLPARSTITRCDRSDCFPQSNAVKTISVGFQTQIPDCFITRSFIACHLEDKHTIVLFWKKIRIYRSLVLTLIAVQKGDNQSEILDHCQ